MQLKIEGIDCYAHHGCLKEETIIGQRYSVDVIFESDFSKAVASDNLNDAVDYCVIHDLVKKEMAIPSKLIEHVAGRILKSIREKYSEVEKIIVRVIKYSPPVHGVIEKATFEITG